MYAARPFRDRILSFQPTSKVVSQELIEHDVERLWNGKSSWRSGENWSEKPQASEIILAVQRLFATMTHTKRSYLDVQELSLLLGYEEGEMISWSLNEPNKGCHRTYETIAEAWRELSWTLFKANHPEPELDEKLLEEYELELRLFHWKGHKLPLPLPEEEGEEKKWTSTDNSTTSLTLNASGDGSNLNEIYACIDAQVWLPEMSQAHFLDGSSQVIAFEIDRKLPSGPSSANAFGEPRSPFKLHDCFWVDRYLLQKRHKIAELREEISRIEGEADVSLARRNQLTMAGDKDLLSTLKATIDYLTFDTQFPTPTLSEREAKKKEMLPKFQQSLARLEAELSSLDERAKTALAEAKAVFDIDEMRQVGPHELCAVVVSDGFSGREHMWTYIKSDDGRWFKSLDQTVTEVTLDTVLSDPAGLHMNSGHIFAIYAMKTTSEQEPADSSNIELPKLLDQAIKNDNELFGVELLEASILPQGAYVPPTEDVEMTGDSPRSDMADAGGPLDLDLVPDGESPSYGPPLRLSGGARSDFADQDDDDDDDDDDDGKEEDLAELGFLKKISKPLNVRTMTGKVGGRPIWLDPETPLDPSSSNCSCCGQSMKFLMQLNAPDDSDPEAYFRTLYVFICPRFSCLRQSLGSGTTSASVVKVFRTQLPQSSPAANVVPRRPNHQGRDVGSFREWEIVCDEEPADSLAGKFGNLALADLPTFELGSQKKGARDQDQDAKVKETKALVDDAFLLFQARIARAPDQILRYLRVKTPEIEPLWANEMGAGELESTLGKQKVCGRCGSERRQEFQIIPTLLSSLAPPPPRKSDPVGQEPRREALDDEDGMDFGTIVVFTCPRSCSAGPAPLLSLNHQTEAPLTLHHAWVQEAAVVQLFSNDGVFSRANPSS